MLWNSSCAKKKPKQYEEKPARQILFNLLTVKFQHKTWQGVYCIRIKWNLVQNQLLSKLLKLRLAQDSANSKALPAKSLIWRNANCLLYGAEYFQGPPAAGGKRASSTPSRARPCIMSTWKGWKRDNMRKQQATQRNWRVSACLPSALAQEVESFKSSW